MFSKSALVSKHPSLFIVAILPILLACGCADDSTGDTPIVNQVVPVEPRPADDATAITKIEDMYGEVLKRTTVSLTLWILEVRLVKVSI